MIEKRLGQSELRREKWETKKLFLGSLGKNVREKEMNHNKTKQNKTKENKSKQNKTKQNKTKQKGRRSVAFMVNMEKQGMKSGAFLVTF